MTKISHKNKAPNNGHDWEVIAVFTGDSVNGVEEQRPYLWVKCRECSDTRVLVGQYFIKG